MELKAGTGGVSRRSRRKLDRDNWPVIGGALHRISRGKIEDVRTVCHGPGGRLVFGTIIIDQPRSLVDRAFVNQSVAVSTLPEEEVDSRTVPQIGFPNLAPHDNGRRPFRLEIS